MVVANIQPEGLTSWTEEHWTAFASKLKEPENEYRGRGYRKNFGGFEQATLIALALGYLNAEDFANIYGYSSLDMLIDWQADVKAGLRNPLFEETNVYQDSFLLVSFIEVKQALGLA